MRELMQAIHLTGPTARDERLLLTTIASFADEQGRLAGWTTSNLMWVTGFPELTIKRRLRSLERAGWLFVFGGAEGQETIYVVQVRKLAARLLSTESGRSAAAWAEAVLGIVQFPNRQQAREVRYR